MAITPRTIFTNPATAAVAAASLFAMTAAGMALFMSCPSQSTYEPCQFEVAEVYEVADTPCDGIAQELSTERAQWSEYDWFRYANCFASAQDSERVIAEASHGIKYYPTSEALFNLKGYHLIQLKRHSEAVDTLELGLRRIGTPQQGTMENNLAWAGMWVPRDLDLYKARVLYKSALTKGSGVCEVIHTGIWVEYGIAKQSQGLERAQALRAFGNLREAYAPCQGRYDDGDRDQLMEVLSAVIAFEDVDRELRANALLGQDPGVATRQLARDVAREVRATSHGTSIDEICREAVPLATAHHTCMDMVQEIVKPNRHARIIR